MINNNFIICTYERDMYIESWATVINIDWKNVDTKEFLIEKIYSELGCPKDFGKNWDAFWDTITDNQFWVKSPLVLIFRNYNYIFSGNKNDRLILSDILIDLINQKRQKYYIFILKK